MRSNESFKPDRPELAFHVPQHTQAPKERHNYAATAGARLSSSASIPTTSVVGYCYAAPAGAIIRRCFLLTAYRLLFTVFPTYCVLDKRKVEVFLVNLRVAGDVNGSEVIFNLCEHVALRAAKGARDFRVDA